MGLPSVPARRKPGEVEIRAGLAGWQAEGFVKSGLVAATESLVGEKEQTKYQ